MLTLLRRAFVGAGFVIAFTSPVAHTQCVDKFHGNLAPLAGVPYTYELGIGLSISRSGDRAFVSVNKLSDGTAHEFLRNPDGTWSPGQQVVSPASVIGSAKAFFAASLAVDGDVLCVGSTDMDRIWIYERIGGVWTFVTTFASPTSGLTDYGISVAVQGDTIVVGEPLGDHPSMPVDNAGLAHVLTRIAGVWTATQVLTAGLPQQNAEFGTDVAIDGDTILVSAKNANGYAGALYAFDKVGASWVQSAQFGATTPPLQQLGATIALSGSRCVASTKSAGGVVVFERIGPFWFPAQFLEGMKGDNDVAIDGDRIAAGDVSDSYVYQGRGAIRIFEREQGLWVPRATIRTPASIGGAEFGRTVALNGDDVLGFCKSPGNPPGTAPAVVCAFSAVPNPKPVYGAGCPGTANFVPALDDLASFDGCFFDGDSVSYRIANGLGGSACVLLISAGQGQTPLQGACSLLVSPVAVSLVVPLFGAGPGGGSITLSSSIPIGVPAASIFMQGFVLDAGATAGYAATNGMRLTVQ